MPSQFDGDVFAFGGAIIAALLAIAGTAWLESRKRLFAIADQAAPMLETLMLVERRSRPFFMYPGERRQHTAQFKEAVGVLSRILSRSPPASGRLLVLFDRLIAAAEELTGELYLTLDEMGHEDRARRGRLEAMLENFDQPLKLLIVHYSRMVDVNLPRSVAHLGPLPEG